MNKNNRKKYLVFGIYSVGAFILTLIIFIYSNTKSHNDPLNIVTVTVNARNSNYCVQSLNMGKFLALVEVSVLFVALNASIGFWSCSKSKL